ncbi:MAG: CinA family protein [Alphaproteobacteria bacterium]
MRTPTLLLAEKLLAAYRRRGWTLSIGESCTGGLLTAYLTSCPGVSSVFTHGFICYSGPAKRDILNVEQNVMEKHGSVSEVVAIQMAKGAATSGNTTVGFGLTGIAGPSGGTRDKPVGLVHGAIFESGRSRSRSWKFRGCRDEIREEAVLHFLEFAKSMPS